MALKWKKWILRERPNLFEFEDQAWFPTRIRNYITDILGHLVKSDLYSPSTEKIKSIMQQTGCDQIVDLCSGSGAPALRLQHDLQMIDYPTKLILTDKYPNAEKVKALSNDNVRYLSHSINALAVAPQLKGFRTLFAAFHHFNPCDAQKILQNSVNNNMPIALFEITERTWASVFFMLLAVPHVLFLTPFLKPFSLQRLFWTYIIPIVPLVYCLDGILSSLRTYTQLELKNMIASLENNAFTWEIGKYSTKIGRINVTYVIGYPTI